MRTNDLKQNDLETNSLKINRLNINSSTKMYLRSHILTSPHAFSTRLGGVSLKSHTSSLNLSFDRGDEDGTVISNLEIFGSHAGFDPHSVISLPQIHSTQIYNVTKENAGEGYYIRGGIRQGDGYITCEKGITLGVKSADCVPILFEGYVNGRVRCIGAVHAGWRGSVSKIAPKCVDMMCSEFGVAPENIRVAIGPCIHRCCFEVGEDFLSEYYGLLGKDFGKKFIYPSDREGKYFCDLVSLNISLLQNVGVKRENIDTVDICTCCNPELFYSHRYSKGNRGTHLSVIWL